MMVSTWFNMFQHVSTCFSMFQHIISTHNFDIFQPWEAGQCLVSHPWMKRNHFYQIFLGFWTTYGSTVGWTLSAMVHLLQENYVVWGPGDVFFFNHYPFFSCLPRLTSLIHFRSWHLQPWFAHRMFGAERASRFPGNMSSRGSISRARPPQEVPTAEWRARRQSVVQATALSAPRTSVAIGERFLQDQKPGAFIKSKKNCKITFIYIIIYHYITDIMCKYNIM